MRPIGTLMLAVISAPLIAVPAMAADCPMPPDLGDAWTVAAPEQEGLNSALICGYWPAPRTPKGSAGSWRRYRSPRATDI